MSDRPSLPPVNPLLTATLDDTPLVPLDGPTVRVDPIDNYDDGTSYIVRGTEDPLVAVTAVRRWLVSDGGLTDNEVSEWSPADPRPGWYRWNPCHPVACYEGGGHRVHFGRASGPGRGNWRDIEIKGTT